MFNSMQHKVWKLFNKETTTTTTRSVSKSENQLCKYYERQQDSNSSENN